MLCGFSGNKGLFLNQTTAAPAVSPPFNENKYYVFFKGCPTPLFPVELMTWSSGFIIFLYLSIRCQDNLK
jgi:hypothetical protein